MLQQPRNSTVTYLFVLTYSQHTLLTIIFTTSLLKSINQWAISVTVICILLPSHRDVNETLAYETETRPRHSVFGPRRDQDQDLPASPRDQDETETSDFCHETRPRPRLCKAETETFFETFNLQHCAITMNGKPASLDITDSSVTATALFIIMKYIHHAHKH